MNTLLCHHKKKKVATTEVWQISEAYGIIRNKRNDSIREETNVSQEVNAHQMREMLRELRVDDGDILGIYLAIRLIEYSYGIC